MNRTTRDNKEYDFSKIPFDNIIRLGERTLLHKDLFCVSWLLGRFCNYSCSYCWPYASSKVKDHRPTSLLIATLDNIKKQARERDLNSFHFSFSGGEPTLHKGLLDLLKHYTADIENSNYQSMHITSNISRSLKWFNEFVEVTKDLHRVSITGSYHREFSNREDFCKKLLFLQDCNMFVTINMVMVPKIFESLWEDVTYFHSRGLNVTLKPQSNEEASCVVKGYKPWMLEQMKKGLPQISYTKRTRTGGDQKYTLPESRVNPEVFLDGDVVMHAELTDKDGETWFIDQTERFNAFEFNKFFGWDCSAGYRSIIIREPDGMIKRSYSCSDKPLGHIESGFKLFDSLRTCITPSCVSSADSKIPKRKKGCELPLWGVSAEQSKNKKSL